LFEKGYETSQEEYEISVDTHVDLLPFFAYGQDAYGFPFPFQSCYRFTDTSWSVDIGDPVFARRNT